MTAPGSGDRPGPWEPAPAVPPVDRDTCLVWWAEPGWLRPELTALLDGAERHRRGRYVRAADRDRFATGVVVTRLVVGALTGVDPALVGLDRSCPACGEPHGPPRPTHRPDLRLSISHARDRVAVAVTRAPGVGVDVEAVERDLDLAGMQAQVLTGQEASALAELDPAERARGFLTYWTRKEAVVKATGDGLRAGLGEIAVTPPHAPPELLAWPDRPDAPARMTLRTLRPGPGYAACLALIDLPAPTVRELSAAALLAR